MFLIGTWGIGDLVDINKRTIQLLRNFKNICISLKEQVMPGSLRKRSDGYVCEFKGSTYL